MRRFLCMVIIVVMMVVAMYGCQEDAVVHKCISCGRDATKSMVGTIGVGGDSNAVQHYCDACWADLMEDNNVIDGGSFDW